MKQSVIFVVVCIMLLISKYVVSGGYYDYTLQQRDLQRSQLSLIDSNKRAIADLENYRSTNFLFSQKEKYGLKELSAENTILVHDAIRETNIEQ